MKTHAKIDKNTFKDMRFDVNVEVTGFRICTEENPCKECENKNK